MLASLVARNLGLILGGYALVFGGLVAYAVSMLRRGRALAKQLPDEDKPWT